MQSRGLHGPGKIRVGVPASLRGGLGFLFGSPSKQMARRTVLAASESL